MWCYFAHRRKVHLEIKTHIPINKEKRTLKFYTQQPISIAISFYHLNVFHLAPFPSRTRSPVFLFHLILWLTFITYRASCLPISGLCDCRRSVSHPLQKCNIWNEIKSNEMDCLCNWLQWTEVEAMKKTVVWHSVRYLVNVNEWHVCVALRALITRNLIHWKSDAEREIYVRARVRRFV